MAKDYDFVIIGGGTSGLVVATRLSEDPNISVLVVEAGADHHDDIRVRTPGLHFSLWNSEADWGFRTEPQVTYHLVFLLI
jgi:choline dehydrogenase-like flavoprotein